jgi:hypothetical protein
MNDSDRQDELIRARIRYLVAEARGAIAGDLRAALTALHEHSAPVDEQATLSRSRLGTLQDALRWHEARPQAAARLQRLDVTLRRLYDKAGNHPGEQQFYLRLRRLIWPEPNPVWLALERPHGLELAPPGWANLFDRLKAPHSARERWEAEARLQLGAAVLAALAATVEIRPLSELLANRNERITP